MRTRFHWKAACACAAVIALALLACLSALAARAEADGMLRVKLARLGSPEAIRLSADCDYYLAEDPSVRIPANTEITVYARNGSLALSAGGRESPLGASAHLMRSAPGNSGISFLSPALSNRFCGDLYLSASGNVITTVLHIFVEDYLYGVVGCEMAPSSGIEALKAQAIVARNYALRQKTARAGSAYDLSDSGDALSFRGYNAAAEYADALRAVDETRGLALYYDGSPATCYFCDSNGGQTESSANAFGASLPYSEVRDDPYDMDSSAAKKTATLSRDASDLVPQLTAALIEGMAEQLEDLQLSADPADVRVTSIDAIEAGSSRYAAPSRLYASLTFYLSVSSRTALGDTRAARVSVNVPTYGAFERWYDLAINEADNETIWIDARDKSFEITFRRSGSGVGLSQRGAQVMAREGFSCQAILDYYFPGVTLRRLELLDATRDDLTVEVTQAPVVADPIASARLSQKSRLYAQADDAAGALTTLPAGATVSVYAVRGSWTAIGSGELYGFVHSEALTSFELAGATPAQVKDETFAQVSDTAGTVDVLQLPVLEADALARLNGGDSVRLIAYTEQWAQVTTAGGVTGYIPRGALSLQNIGTDSDIAVAPEGLYGLLTEASQLYSSADDSLSPMRTLDKGQYVQLMAYSQSWAYVRTEDGLTGYVKLGAVSPVRQSQPEPAAEPGIEGGEITKVQGKVYRYVNVDSLHMYSSYSTDSMVLATLTRGQQVRLGAYNGVWACVRADGATGFVALDALSETAPDAPAVKIEGGEITYVQGERYALVVMDDVPVYPSAGESEAPLMLLSADERVRVGAYNSAWACIRVNDVTGFVRIGALKVE